MTVVEMKDAYGNRVSSSSRAAVDAHDGGVRCYTEMLLDTAAA